MRLSANTSVGCAAAGKNRAALQWELARWQHSGAKRLWKTDLYDRAAWLDIAKPAFPPGSERDRLRNKLDEDFGAVTLTVEKVETLRR